MGFVFDKKWLTDKLNKQKDKCVFCNKETEYDVTTHIDFRMYYIEGAGQLCKRCYELIQDSNHE